MSNDSQVLKIIVDDIGHLAGTAEEAANKLGIEYTCGKRRPKRGGPRRARYHKQLTRRRRLTKLQKLGCSIGQVVRRGVIPAASYGGTVHGVSDHELEILSSLAAAAVPPNTRGTSRTLKLQLHGDPAVEANTGILQFWAGAAWRACGPAKVRRRTDPSPVLLDNAVKRADRELSASGYKWENVRGPAGAAIMTARRIGWQFVSGLRIADERGSMIDLGTTDPHNVRAAVVRATRATAMVRASQKEGLGETADGIWVAPVTRALQNKRITPMARAALRRAFTGGNWTRARLMAQGLCADKVCERCGEAHDDDHHRIWECIATEPLRLKYTTEDMRHGAETAARNHPYWTRAVTLNPRASVPPPRRDFDEEWHFGRGVDNERNFTGTVYTDGSAFHPQCADVRRAGWAVVQVDSSGRVEKALFGHVPASISTDQTVAAGELFAMRRAVELSIGELTIKTDYQGILDGSQAGEAATTSAKRPNAASWRAFWRATNGATPRIQKVKAHRSREEAAADEDPESILDWMGNKAADEYAKKGAARHMNAAGHKAAEVYENEFKLLIATASWIGIALSQWPRLTGRRPLNKHWRREMGQRRRTRRQLAAHSQGHNMAHGRDGRHCTTCGRKSSTWAGTKRLALSECRGHTASRIRTQGPGPSAHVLWAAEAERSQTGALAPDVVWCGRCGAYSSAKVYNLARTCRGVPEKSARTRLAAFNIGIHPINRHRLAPPVRLTDEVLAALSLGAARRRAAFNKLLRGDPTADRRESAAEQPGSTDHAEDETGNHHALEMASVDMHIESHDLPGIPEYAEEEQDIFGHGCSLDEPPEGGGGPTAKRQMLQEPRSVNDEDGIGTSARYTGLTADDYSTDQPWKRRRPNPELGDGPHGHHAVESIAAGTEGPEYPAAAEPADAQLAAADTSRASQAAATHARQDDVNSVASGAASPPARAPVGDKPADGRSARTRLFEPSHALSSHGVTIASPPGEQEFKRRRIRGKQSPADARSGGQPSASWPARPSVVDQHGQSSAGPWPHA